ncbi:hypothetical protein, partial [Lacihabitans soyangensis]
MKEYVLTWGGLHNHEWLSEEAVKKARLQNSVLTYRNGIRGYDRWISMHINTKSVANKPIRVDF